MECSCQETDLLERVSQISNIIFASATLALTFYVFVYQREKDKHNNKLQWFKDLIIEPHKEYIHKFFSEFIEEAGHLKDYQLTDTIKINVIDSLKSKSASFRRNFIVLLGSVDQELERDILNSIDNLVDLITRATFDANYNLSDAAVFDSTIEIHISQTRIYVLARIFKYEG